MASEVCGDAVPGRTVKLALIALPAELRMYARCIASIEGVRWIGYGGYACAYPHIDLSGREGAEECVRCYVSADAMMDVADVVLVAGLEEDRFRFVSSALRKGKHVWAIGPVCSTWEETAKLAALAQEAMVCNQAAHLARESAVLKAAMGQWDGVRLIRFETACLISSPLNAEWERFLLFPAFDRLMALGDAPLRKMKARSVSCMGIPQAGIVADLEFMSGMEAFLSLDRVAEKPASCLVAMSPEKSIRLDFLAGKAEWRGVLASAGGSRVVCNSLEIRPVRLLQQNIASFVRTVREGRHPSFGFLQSSEVQERFSQLKKLVYA